MIADDNLLVLGGRVNKLGVYGVYFSPWLMVKYSVKLIFSVFFEVFS